MTQIFSSSIDKCISEILNIHKSNPKTFVAVGGLSRSGKSTLINIIKETLILKNITSTSISLDYWILSLDKRNVSMNVKDRYQYDLISKDLSLLLETGFIEICPYEPLTRSISSQKLSISIVNAEVIFIDGVIALDHPFIRTISSLKIFIEINEEIRAKRFIDFYRSKNIANNDILILYHQRMKDEYELVKESICNSDIVIQL